MALFGVYSVVSLLVALALLVMLWVNLPKLLWLHYKRVKHLKSLSSVWPSHWFWGSEVTLDEQTLNKWTNFVRENRIKATVFWVGPFFAHVAIAHPDLVKPLLKEEKSYPIYKMLVPWLGEGLLISRGKKWARSRRLLTPAFHFEILKGYISVYNDCVQILLEKWKTDAQQGSPVKLFDTISLLSLDIVLQCAFSYKSDCQTMKLRHPYVKAVYELVDLCTERFMNPFYHLDFVFALSPLGWKTRKACRIVHTHSVNVINQRKQALDLLQSSKHDNFDLDALHNEVTKTRKYLDFLDILLTATDEDGSGLSDTDIRAEVDTFMFEGHDTTTSGICWTLYCLAKHPEHQEKVREEVRSVLMGREWLEYDDLKELKYTQWCIKEAMRLYPPVFEIYRKVSEDVKLGDILIPEGTQFSFMIHAIHHHPDVWEDPEQFDPLRFHPSNVEKRDPYAYIPFSAGHRNCIGQNFAMNEEKVVVGTIVSRFRLKLDDTHKVEVVPKVVLRTKNDIKLVLQEL